MKKEKIKDELRRFILYMIKFFVAPCTITFYYLHSVIGIHPVISFVISNVFWGVLFYIFDRWLFTKYKQKNKQKTKK